MPERPLDECSIVAHCFVSNRHTGLPGCANHRPGRYVTKDCPEKGKPVKWEPAQSTVAGGWEIPDQFPWKSDTGRAYSDEETAG